MLFRQSTYHSTAANLNRRDLLLLALATLLVTLITFLFGLLGSGGHLAAPLDDTFIHFQYARQLASGHPFQYNTGDVPSSGESSFIYPFLLAPAFLLGMDGVDVLWYAVILGFIAHLAAVLFLYKLAVHLFNRPTALFSAIFLIIDGRANWNFLSGMETGIYTGALITFFYALARSIPANKFGPTAAIGILTALLRPDGHVVVSVVCLAAMIYLLRSKGFNRSFVWLLLPIVIGALPYLVNILLTGHWQFNTAVGKSSFFTPYLPLVQQLNLIPVHFYELFNDILLGLNVPYSPFPILITLPLAALGAWYAYTKRSHALLNTLFLMGLVVGLALALIPRGTQYYRYFQPYDPIIWLYFSAGLAWLIEQCRAVFDRNNPSIDRSGRALYAWLGGAVFLLIVPQFLRYFFLMSETTRDIYYQQMTFSYWIRSNTPADARIGVNDVGAHKYIGNRRIIDVLGLTENRMRGVFYSGWGSIYDALVRFPASERPQYLLIHPEFFVNDVNPSVNQGFLMPIYSINVPNIAITVGATETLYSINWDRAKLDPTETYLTHDAQAPLDSINIADLIDEKAHSYRIEGKQAPVAEPKSFVTTGDYSASLVGLTDSGRKHSGWEEFTVKSLPNQSLTLVSRSLLSPDAAQKIKVFADNKEVGIWESHNSRATLWQEYEYTIPATFITSDHTIITIDAAFDPGGPGFTSYRYWVYAP